jgi:hypothetical protein
MSNNPKSAENEAASLYLSVSRCDELLSARTSRLMIAIFMIVYWWAIGLGIVSLWHWIVR